MASLPLLTCPACGLQDTPTLHPGMGPHVARADCGGCGRFLQWLPKALVQPYEMELAEPATRHPSPAVRGLSPVPGHPVRMRVRWADPPSGLPDIRPPIPGVIAVHPGVFWTGRGTNGFCMGDRWRNPHIHSRVRRSRRGEQHAREGQHPESAQGAQRLWHNVLLSREPVAQTLRRLRSPTRRAVPHTILSGKFYATCRRETTPDSSRYAVIAMGRSGSRSAGQDHLYDEDTRLICLRTHRIPPIRRHGAA